MIYFDDNDIVLFCGERAQKKGQSCASSGNFIKVFVQDDILFGIYSGSAGIYKINLITEENIPSFAWCTCPSMSTGWDRNCKHIAGIMILANIEPTSFVKLKSWNTLLQTKSKDDLIKLIKKASAKSVHTINAFYEELLGKPLFEEEELYDQDWQVNQ